VSKKRKKKKEVGRKYYSHWHLPTPLLFDRRFFLFSIKEKIERASGGDNGMAEKRVGWLAGFLSRKKENWGFLSFKTLGNKSLSSSSLSSFALFPGLGDVVVAGMAPRPSPPPAAAARGFFPHIGFLAIV
jgi:hypothetical protein